MSKEATTKRKYRAACAYCGKVFYISKSIPVAYCSGSHRRAAHYQRQKVHRLDKARESEREGVYQDWIPTPKEILERRLELHEQHQVAETEEINQQAAAMIRRQLEELERQPPRDPRTMSLGELRLASDTLTALEEAGLETVSDLLGRSDEELIAIPRIGNQSLAKIRSAVGVMMGSLTAMEQQDADNKNPQGARH